MSTVAVIGKSVVIKGELSGAEDLTVEGTVEGKITLTKNVLMVGAEGRVLADVQAQTVTVTGKVEGNITVTDVLEITASGSVKGNISAPRLVIADGAFFQGSIEMGQASTTKQQPAKVVGVPSGAKPVAEVA